MAHRENFPLQLPPINSKYGNFHAAWLSGGNPTDSDASTIVAAITLFIGPPMEPPATSVVGQRPGTRHREPFVGEAICSPG